MNLRSWLLAARPKTLPAAVVPVLLGGWLAQCLTETAHWNYVLLALFSCLCLQVATNLFNDAIDFQKGADTQGRIGPQRVTQSGLLSMRSVLIAAAFFLVLAAALAFPLLQARGWPILAIGIPSLYLCFGYTGGPLPLAYLGLGELFVIIFFGFVAVMGTFFVASGTLQWQAGLAGAQVGLLSTLLIAINNFRDIEGDALVGKRTLAVRFGARFARWEICLLTLFAYGAGIGWFLSGFSSAMMLPLLALPFGMFIVGKVFRSEPGVAYNRYLAMAAIQLLVFAGLLAFGLGRDVG